MDKAAVLWLALALAAPVYSERESNVGAAYYGIQHPDWPCAQSLRVFKGVRHPQISILWNTFGTGEACIRKFLSDPRPAVKTIEIHLVNECCIRNRSCAWYEFGHGYTKASYEAAILSGDKKFYRKLDKYLRAPALLIAAYRGDPTVKCLISPGLESNLGRAGMERLLEFVRPYFPQCRFVSHGRHVKGAKFAESHVRAADPPCILSNDNGLWPPDDLGKWISTGRPCRAFFAWHPRFNGWEPGAVTGGPDPRGRTNWPGRGEFAWQRRNMR